MKNNILKGLVAAAAMAFAASSYGIIIWEDTNTYDGNGIDIGNDNTSGEVNPFEDFFDITPAFVPGAHVVTSAWAKFWISDDKDKLGGEEILVNLDGLFGGALDLPNVASTIFEIASLNVNILAQLNLDGKLVYAVSQTSGNQDFYLTKAMLHAEGDRVATPDSAATLGLLGLGLAGLALARRKLS